jgi:hypothetical protein
MTMQRQDSLAKADFHEILVVAAPRLRFRGGSAGGANIEILGGSLSCHEYDV